MDRYPLGGRVPPMGTSGLQHDRPPLIKVSRQHPRAFTCPHASCLQMWSRTGPPASRLVSPHPGAAAVSYHSSALCICSPTGPVRYRPCRLSSPWVSPPSLCSKAQAVLPVPEISVLHTWEMLGLGVRRACVSGHLASQFLLASRRDEP